MGIYDREYYQDEHPPGISLGNMTRSMVVTLILLTIGLYIADALSPGMVGERLAEGSEPISTRWLNDKLCLHADAVQRPWTLYSLLSYGFMHQPLGTRGALFHLGFNMFVLWMFGRELEIQLGRFEFLRFYLVAIVVAGLAWLISRQLSGATAATCVGASGGIMAVVIAWVLRNWNREVLLFGLLRMPAWGMALLLVIIDLSNAFSSESNVAWEAHLGGMAFGLAYTKLHWNLGRFFPRSSTLPRRSRLKIHRPTENSANIDAQADAILDKLHREGQDALTKKERKILEDYSRRMRQKHR